MSIPAEHRWLFWDVDPDAIVLERDRRYLLGRVLERGRLVDVRWGVRACGEEAVHQFFRDGGHPELSAPALALWRAFFNETGNAWQSPATWRKSSSAPWIE